MQTLSVEEKGPQKSKKGYFVSKNLTLLLVTFVSVIIAGSVLITYYTKPNECGEVDSKQCESLACKNPSFLQTWNSQCTKTTTTKTTAKVTTKPVTTIVITTSTGSTTPAKKNYRISRDLLPSFYEITIQPYFKPESMPEYFKGKVAIDFTCEKETNKLVLHKKDLDLDNSTLLLTSASDADFSERKNFPFSYDSDTHFLTFEFDKSFKVGSHYRFSVEYKGYTTDDELGFYRSYYTDSNDKKRWLVTSQMEYIEARKSFVSFDEPAFKAKFRLSIIHDQSLNVWANTEIKTTVPYKNEDGYVWVKTDFVDTIQMSTYLVAILKSDFKCKEGQAKPSNTHSIDVSVCAKPAGYADLELAYEASIKTIEFFENFYGIEYPLKKIDHAGVPQFKYGAMENWGLAIYKESNFLYNKKTSSILTELNVVRIVAHEVSHMWFGNWVTPKWWNDLWLNEGFARFMEHAGADFVRPTWRAFDRLFQLITDVIQSDSSDETREISTDVNTPEEIDANINPTITYGKGGAIVKMLTYILGEETFRRGLTSYFQKFSLQNVDQYDLWKSLYDVAKSEDKLENFNKYEDFKKTMESWTLQKGHPLLTVTRLNNTHISVQQNRFVLDSNYPSESLKETKWNIPFSYSIESSQSSVREINTLIVNPNNLFDKVQWVGSQKETIALNKKINDDDFIIANLDMAGFYRINYDENNWKLIIEQLAKDHEKLSARTRAQLISDIFSLSQAGYLNAKHPLNLIKYMSKEFDYLPWNVIINNRINFYYDMLDSSEFSSDFKSYVGQLIEPYYKKLDWVENENDEWVDNFLRANVVQLACKMDVSHCIAKSKQYFSEWMNNVNNNKIPTTLKSTAYCYAIKYGGQEEFNFLFDQLKQNNKANVKSDLLVGLACAKEMPLIEKFLNDRLVNSNDTLSALRSVITRSSFLYAWNFIKNNAEELYSRYSESDAAGLKGVLTDLTNRLNTPSQYDDFATLFTNKDINPTLAKDIEVMKKKVKSNINWYKTNKAELAGFFNANTPEPETINYRLPKSLKPKLYELNVKPYIGPEDRYGSKAFTHESEITIHFTCVEPTKQIIFHSVNLNLDADSLRLTSTSGSNDVIVEKKIKYDSVRDFSIVSMSKECAKNAEYSLHLKYTGQISTSLFGFYRSSYINEKGERVYLAVTDLEPSNARRVFPCFDEPAMKAKFKLTMNRDNRYFTSSLFNTPIESTTTNGDWTAETFKETVEMSTYLVCFVVSDFKHIETKSLKGKDIQVYAKAQAIDNKEGKFGLEEAAKVIDFFADYFNMPYPLDKSTQIAIPDFNPGAMENWGLITYREVSLLYNEARDTILEKRRISVVISHELAHQWFGNLVTPLWWNDIWLNEGFASYVEYLGYTHTHPEWRDLEFFFVQKLNTLVKDSLETSHPISVKVNNPSEVSSLFDTISYDKGASVIRMMSAFLTQESFKKGVSNYLNKYQLSNAEQDNLWDMLTEQAHKDKTLDAALTVKQIMDTWTLKMGYPVVTLSRDYTNNKMVAEQKWFLLNPLNKVSQAEMDKYKWYIPLTYTTELDSNFNIESQVNWIKPEDKEVVISLPAQLKSDNWIIGNLQHGGFYRVNYDEENWKLLASQLSKDHKDINPVNRAELIDDSFNLGKAEYIDQLVFFDLIKYMEKEVDSLPFVPAIYGLNVISNLLAEYWEVYSLYQKYYMKLLEKNYERLGWNMLNDPNDVNLQISTNQVMCKFGKKECIDEAKSIYYKWFNDKEDINPNFKSNVYATAIRSGSTEDWWGLYNRALVTADNQERLKMLRGLAATQNYELLKYFLSKTSDPSVVRNQDQVSIITTISDNPVARKLVYDHLEENWDYFFNLYGNVPFTLPNLVETALNKLTTRNDLKRVETFIATHSDLGIARGAFKNGLETINTNVRWVEKNLDSLKK